VIYMLYACFRKMREVRAPALVPVRCLGAEICWPPSRVRQTVRICAEPDPKAPPSEKKIPSIQLDICDGSSTSDNGAVPLSPMMRALTSLGEVAYRLLLLQSGEKTS
jgi:hypothetical protein